MSWFSRKEDEGPHCAIPVVSEQELERIKKHEKELKEHQDECAKIEADDVAEMKAAIDTISTYEGAVIYSIGDRKLLLNAIRKWRNGPAWSGVYHYFPMPPWKGLLYPVFVSYRPPQDSEYIATARLLYEKAKQANEKLSASYGPVAGGFSLLADEESNDGTFRETVFMQKRGSGVLQKHVITTMKGGVKSVSVQLVFIPNSK